MKRVLFQISLFLSPLLAHAAIVEKWNNPFPAHHVVGNVYYVGTNYLASFLITTDQGHILINTSYEESVPLIKASVEKLGFKFSDIKIILLSHAHDDHCAGTAKVKQMTGARVMVMDSDVKEIEDGGTSDFYYKDMRWPPLKVDRILNDGDEVRLGDAVLVARKTPGHTKGCTTWTMKSAGQSVVIVGSPNVNTGYKLVNNMEYPGIAEDYKKTFAVLKSLPCDVFLGAHGAYYDLDAKYPKLNFVDPAGYKAYVADREQAFLAELKKQSHK